MARWQYQVTFMHADATEKDAKALLDRRYPGVRFAKYAPLALSAELDAWGGDGWELISIQPVVIGTNGDIGHVSTTQWSNAYLCAFRRERAV